MTSLDLLFVIAAFFVGALPFGFLLGRLKGIDIRHEGSGNIGATNVGRVMGIRWAIVVFLLDFSKGFVPAMVATFLEPKGEVLFASPWSVSVVAAVMPVLGHMYSPFLGGRGGKGVATAFGAFVYLSPWISLASFAVWGIALFALGFVSVASIAASWFFPLATWLASGRERSEILYGALAIALFITWRHRGNLARLWRGEEPKIRGSARSDAPAAIASPDSKAPEPR